MSPSSSIRDFAQYAGRFLWPRSTADLTSTAHCPACRTPLPSPVCPSCGLDLRHPAARDLLAASTEAATALDRRVQLIGQIRHEVAQAESTAAAAAQQRARDQVAAHAALTERNAAAAREEGARLAAEQAAAHTAAQVAARTAAKTAAQARAALASAPPASPTISAPAAAAGPDHPAAPDLPPFAAPGYRPPVTAAPAPAPAVPADSPGAEHPQPAPAAPPRAATPPPAGEGDGPPPHKRSSVQIVLLLVGVTLVSVAAIFFLTVAFIVTGLAFRASVVAVLTLGTLVTAALLRRKRLVATAEGIGALAVVFVLLDAWAMRRLNLFGFGDGDALLYWGAALLVCTVLFLGWHALSSLRVASVAGFAAAAPAVGLLAAGFAADAAPLTRLFLAALGAAVGALLHRFTVPGSAGFWPSLDRRAERIALLAVAGLALLTATGLAGAVQPASTWAPLLTFGVVALVAAAHALTVLLPARPDASSRVAAHASVALAALAGVLGVTVCTWRSENVNLMVSVPLLVAAVITLGFELAWRLRAAGPARGPLLTGALTAGSLLALAGFAAAATAAIPLLRSLVADYADPIARVTSESTSALAALAGVAVLVAGFWRAGGVLAARRALLLWFGAVVLLLAVPFTQWLWLIVPLYLVLGAVALAALFLARSSRPGLRRFRPQLVLVFAAAEAFGYLISWTDSSIWWLGSLSAVAALVVARYLLDRQARAAGRGALLSGAILLTLIGVAAAPWALTLAAPPTGAVLLLHSVLAVAVSTGVLQLLVALGRVARFTDTERRWAFWTLLAPTLYLIAAPTGRLIDALPAAQRATLAPLAPALGILATVLILAATLLWALRQTLGLRAERLTAALLVAPGLLALATNLVLVTDAPAGLTRLTAPTATLLTVALALVLRVTGRSSRAGLGLEVGAAVVLATAFLPLDNLELGWLALLLTGVAVLFTAVDADGLFASGSWRRHLGWLSLVLATAGLWWGLGDSGTTPLEAYVLPVAGTVLAVAALLWRYGRVDRKLAASPGAALLTFAGLGLALLPLALTGQTGSVLRPILVGAAAAVLLIGAALVRWTAPRWAFLAAAGLAGASALLVTGVARSLRTITAVAPAGPVLEAWLLPATVLLAVAAVLLVRPNHVTSPLVRHRASLVLVLVALATLTSLEAAAFDSSRLGAARPIALVLILAILHVLPLRRPRVPFGIVTAWFSIALAGTAAVAAILVGALDPFEVVVVPVGLALVAGQLLLNRPWSSGAGTSAPAAHNWIGLGLGLTLLPSAAVAALSADTTLGSTGLTDDALRQLLTLALGGLLAVGGALLLPRPRWSLVSWPGVLVGSATVIVTGTGRIQALLATGFDGPDWRLEAWLVPAALLLIGAGALVIRAFPALPVAAAGASADAQAGSAQAVAAGPTPPRALGYGLVVLALLGILIAETTALTYLPYAAGRALALIGLFAVLHVLLRWTDRSRAGSLLAWFTIAAGVLTLVTGAGRDLLDPIEWATVPLGLSLVLGQLVAARVLGRSDHATPGAAPLPLQVWLGTGLALALLPSVAVGWDGDLLRPVLTLAAGGVLAVGGALLMNRPRWNVLAWPGTVVGAAAVLLTAGGRIQPLLDATPAGPDGRLEAWLVPAALLLTAAGALVIAGSPAPAPSAVRLPAGPAQRPTDVGEPRRLLGYGLVILALVGILAAEVAALPYAPYGDGRMIGLVALFAMLHVAVRWIDRSSAGTVLAWFAIAAGLLAVLQGWTLGLPDPLELGTIPLGLSLVAGQLIVLGLLGHRPGRGTDGGAPSSSRLAGQTWLAVGLAVAVLPSVVEGAEGTLLRPVLGLVLGGALGILGAWLLTRSRWSVLAWPACGVGVVAVLASAALQIVPLYRGPTGPSGELEAWLIPAALLLVATGARLVWTTWVAASATAAAAGTAGSPAPVNGAIDPADPRVAGPTGPSRTVWAGYGLVIAALAGVVLAELPALDYAPLAMLRVVLVVWLFSALYLGVFWADESRLGRLVAWVALAGAAVSVVAGWAQGVPDPVEIVTVPLALALVASGLLHLDRTPAARSWITLAPGLLVLLLPSLFLDLTYSPLWRVVGLGVLTVAVLVLGTVRRLQAPFLIGAVVLLVHALAQLWPWISLAYGVVPWWLWLGIGGVLLIVLAARYEQRIQNLKTVALRISALR